MTPFFIPFFNVHIIKVNCAKFQKKGLIVEQFQGNYLKVCESDCIQINETWEFEPCIQFVYYMYSIGSNN